MVIQTQLCSIPAVCINKALGVWVCALGVWVWVHWVGVLLQTIVLQVKT